MSRKQWPPVEMDGPTLSRGQAAGANLLIGSDGEDEIMYPCIRAAPPTRRPGHNNEVGARVRA